MARPPRFERGLSDFKGRRVNQLHYGRIWRFRGGAEGLASFFSTSPPRNLMCSLRPRNGDNIAVPYPTFRSAKASFSFTACGASSLADGAFPSRHTREGRDCGKSETHHVMPYLHENPNRRLGGKRRDRTALPVPRTGVQTITLRSPNWLSHLSSHQPFEVAAVQAP